jgi:hypothetical protein
MNETQGSTVWTEADERRSVAGYHAHLTQQFGYWAHTCCVGMLVPFFGTGVMGIFLLAGVAVLMVAIPVRVAIWHHRYRALDPENLEMVASRKTLRRALVLWGLTPVTFTIVAVVMALVYGRLDQR